MRGISLRRGVLGTAVAILTLATTVGSAHALVVPPNKPVTPVSLKLNRSDNGKVFAVKEGTVISVDLSGTGFTDATVKNSYPDKAGQVILAGSGNNSFTAKNPGTADIAGINFPKIYAGTNSAPTTGGPMIPAQTPWKVTIRVTQPGSTVTISKADSGTRITVSPGTTIKVNLSGTGFTTAGVANSTPDAKGQVVLASASTNTFTAKNPGVAYIVGKQSIYASGGTPNMAIFSVRIRVAG